MPSRSKTGMPSRCVLENVPFSSTCIVHLREAVHFTQPPRLQGVTSKLHPGLSKCAALQVSASVLLTKYITITSYCFYASSLQDHFNQHERRNHAQRPDFVAAAHVAEFGTCQQPAGHTTRTKQQVTSTAREPDARQALLWMAKACTAACTWDMETNVMPVAPVAEQPQEPQPGRCVTSKARPQQDGLPSKSGRARQCV